MRCRTAARVICAAALPALAALPTGTRAATADRYSVDIQAVFSRAGNPSLVANFSEGDDKAKPAWSVCRPPDTTACTAVHRRIVYDSPRVPAGTVFQAAARYQGDTYVARTAPWRGTVHAIARPSLSGEARVGGTVAPVGGRWRGGWPGDFSFRRIEACRTADARHCVTVMDTNRMHPGPHRHVAVPARYAGWWLFAFEERLPRDVAFAEPGYGRPSDLPPLRTSRTVVRSAPGVRVSG